MAHRINFQFACTDSIPVTKKQLKEWVNLALKITKKSSELTLRLVSPEEMIHLNKNYRQQNKTTNVLAFPTQLPEHIVLQYHLLGDVVICPQVLHEESDSLEVDLVAHWAHISIHGVLHLLGYDHINREDEVVMQAIEIKLLEQLGFKNPYER